MISGEDNLPESSLNQDLRFEELTRSLLGSLTRTAFRMTGCQEIARDLTQETCLRAYRSLNSYHEGTNYKAWIFRILTNICMDYLRREARAPFKEWNDEEVDGAVASIENRAARPDSSLEQSSFYSDAINAIGQLPVDIRVVVCFSLLDGLSYQEISEILGIPIGTVRSRLSRGRKKLQLCLVEHIKDESLLGWPRCNRNETMNHIKIKSLKVITNKQKLKCR